MELGYKRSEMKERVRWRDWESVLQGTLRSYNILGLHQAGWQEREIRRGYHASPSLLEMEIVAARRLVFPECLLIRSKSLIA